MEHGKHTHGLKETFKTVLWAIVIALAVRTFAYEPFNIPSGSMIPTLLVGDYLFVSKASYGYSSHSLPFGLRLIPGRIFYDEPQRGDVVVFKLPSDNKTDYIKRLVGLPGDRIQVRGGILYVNDQPVERHRVDDFVTESDVGLHRRARYQEVLPGGRAHYILEESDFGPFDDTRVYTVPEDHFFAMGDNRDHSQDSRFLDKVGFVPKENLVGRAEFIFFSIDGPLWKMWEWPWTIRFNRLFQGIE